nr:helix-turn-helix domain-containing protein [Lactiplantibacillus plantarum]
MARELHRNPSTISRELKRGPIRQSRPQPQAV